MKLEISTHALGRASESGATEKEIRETVLEGLRGTVKHGRLRKYKVYSFNQFRQGRFYSEKRVEVVYTVDQDRWAVITVYVLYGKWS